MPRKPTSQGAADAEGFVDDPDLADGLRRGFVALADEDLALLDGEEDGLDVRDRAVLRRASVSTLVKVTLGERKPKDRLMSRPFLRAREGRGR